MQYQVILKFESFFEMLVPVMLGAVCWFDKAEKKAVLISEDLAGFVFAEIEDPLVSLNEGDLYAFDLKNVNNRFQAVNLRAVDTRQKAEPVHRQPVERENKIVLFPQPSNPQSTSGAALYRSKMKE